LLDNYSKTEHKYLGRTFSRAAATSAAQITGGQECDPLMAVTGHIDVRQPGRHRPQAATPPHAGDRHPPHHSATGLAEQPATRPLLPTRVLVWALFLLIAAAALWVTMHVHAERTVLTVALFVHIISLVVGFGAVLTVDFQAAMWMLGRRKLEDVVRFGSYTHALIWIGLAGLVLSGALLHPNLSSSHTRVKLILVVVVVLNGLSVLGILEKLEQAPGRRLPPGLLLRATAAVLISQGAWWGATAIGFLSAQSASTGVQRAPRVSASPDELRLKSGQGGIARITEPPASSARRQADVPKATTRIAGTQHRAVDQHPAVQAPASPSDRQRAAAQVCRALSAAQRASAASIPQSLIPLLRRAHIVLPVVPGSSACGH
jgi:hypothetical protein